MAANPTVDGFRQYYPMFNDVPDEIVQAALSRATNFIGIDRACLRTDTAREAAIYALTAHLLFLMQQANDGIYAPLSSASEGSVSASFATPILNNKSWFSESPFGREFWLLMAPCRLGGAQFTPFNYHPWG